MSDELANNSEPELAEANEPELELAEENLSEEDYQEDDAGESFDEDSEGEEDESGQSEDDESEPEFVDVEYDGETYKVPPALKDAVMRQADYTRKSQEVAAKVRELEAQTESFNRQRELQEATREQSLELAKVDDYLAAFSQVNWEQLMQEDPQEFQRLDWNRRKLVEQRQHIASQIAQAEQEAFQKQREDYAKRKEQALQQVSRAIPGWNRETAEKLKEYGLQAGFSEARLKTLVDPTDIVTLDKARRWDELQAARKQTKKPKAEVKDPPTPLKTKSAPAKKPMAKMSQKEWLRERERQLERKQKARS
jgi:hypothetical protein